MENESVKYNRAARRFLVQAIEDGVDPVIRIARLLREVDEYRPRRFPKRWPILGRLPTPYEWLLRYIDGAVHDSDEVNARAVANLEALNRERDAQPVSASTLDDFHMNGTNISATTRHLMEALECRETDRAKALIRGLGTAMRVDVDDLRDAERDVLGDPETSSSWPGVQTFAGDRLWIEDGEVRMGPDRRSFHRLVTARLLPTVRDLLAKEPSR